MTTIEEQRLIEAPTSSYYGYVTRILDRLRACYDTNAAGDFKKIIERFKIGAVIELYIASMPPTHVTKYESYEFSLFFLYSIIYEWENFAKRDDIRVKFHDAIDILDSVRNLTPGYRNAELENRKMSMFDLTVLSVAAITWGDVVMVVDAMFTRVRNTLEPIPYTSVMRSYIESYNHGSTYVLHDIEKHLSCVWRHVLDDIKSQKLRDTTELTSEARATLKETALNGVKFAGEPTAVVKVVPETKPDVIKQTTPTISADTKPRQRQMIICTNWKNDSVKGFDSKPMRNLSLFMIMLRTCPKVAYDEAMRGYISDTELCYVTPDGYSALSYLAGGSDIDCDRIGLIRRLVAAGANTKCRYVTDKTSGKQVCNGLLPSAIRNTHDDESFKRLTEIISIVQPLTIPLEHVCSLLFDRTRSNHKPTVEMKRRVITLLVEKNIVVSPMTFELFKELRKYSDTDVELIFDAIKK